jgi:hypothetical protein
MKQISILLLFITLFSCQSNSTKNNEPTSKAEAKHHLNIPEEGIESLMEANSKKIIEGTDGSVVIEIGIVTRKEADIAVKLDDKILQEKLVGENQSLSFDYEKNNYTIEVGNIKKPLIGSGKVNIKIK